ncbi:MAG: VOC family protein, partial [Erythrobacter sp.]|nr:VOC family protein [Erythrobacter sp.]
MADDKLALCLWFATEAEEAANFYCDLFPQSEIASVDRSPSDWPGGKAGDVITVGFTLLGVRAMAMNGGPGD